MKNERGITLIALIITIIVMMILTAVTVTIALNGGLFNYAGKARTDTLKAMAREEVQIAVADYKMESIINGEESIVFGDFINAMLTEDIVAFVETDATWEFNYKGFGFIVSKEDISINVGEATKIYKLIETAGELKSDEEYLIASGKYADVYVLDKQIEGDVAQEEEEEQEQEQEQEQETQSLQGPRRDIANYKVSVNSSIYYKGEYALKLNESDNGWTLYDSKNKKYLTNSYSEYESDRGNILDITNKKEYFSIEFGEDGEAIIKAENENNIRAVVSSQKKFFSCYSDETSGSAVYLYKYFGATEPYVLFTPQVNVNVESNKVTLFWNPIYSAKNYTIKWDGKDIVTDQTIYVFDNLMNGSEHTFQVRANKDVADNTRKNSEFTEEQIVVPSSGEYKLVEKGEELVSGARYLVYTFNENNSSQYYPRLMGEQQSDKNRRDAIGDISVVNNIIKHNGEYAVKLESTENNLWKIKDIANSKYIYSPSNKNICIGTNDSNNNYKFSISITNGKAVITSQGSAKLQYNYNNGTDFFSFYTSNQIPISLYKETDGTQATNPTEPTGPVQLTNPVVVANAEGKHVTLTWENDPNAVSYTVIWNEDEEHPIQNITTGSWSKDVDTEDIYNYKVMAVGDGESYESSNYTEGTINVVQTVPYKLVTSIKELEVGADYIIATKSATRYALDAPGGTNFDKRNAYVVTITNNNKIYYNSFYPLTLLEWSEDDLPEEAATDLLDTNTNTYYKFYDARSGGYLAGVDNTNNEKFDNKLYTKGTLDQFSYFTISFSQEGNGKVIITNTNGGMIKANISNNPPLFRCYESGQTDVYLFKKEVITKDVITFTANDDEYEAEPGMTWEERIGSSYDTSGGLFEINEDNYDFPVVMFRKVDLHIGIGGPLIKPNEEIISENYFGW